MEPQTRWRKLEGISLRVSIEEEVRQVMVRENEAGHQLKVCIATDSQVKERETE